jgi:hypothetical protein
MVGKLRTLIGGPRWPNRPALKIPHQLRELTEKNLEQARAGYGQFLDAMNQAMGF